MSVTVPGHAHPGPPLPRVPGEPLGVPRPVYLTLVSDLVGSHQAGCARCVAGLLETLAYRRLLLALLASVFYVRDPLPHGLPVPRPELVTLARECAAGPYRDFTALRERVERLDHGSCRELARHLGWLATGSAATVGPRVSASSWPRALEP